jgi:hypothetical protein
MNPQAFFHEYITTESAHMSLDEAVADFPVEHINDKAPNVTYSFWHILDHIRITQYDLLKYFSDSTYTSPNWPEGYWPKPEEKTDKKGWQETIAAIHADWDKIVAVVSDPKTDIFAAVPFANNKSIFRCVLLILEHNSYHLGEFGVLRQVCNLWPKERKE